MMSLPSHDIPADGLESFTDASAAVDRLIAHYDAATQYIEHNFAEYTEDSSFDREVRACYPWVGIRVHHEAGELDARASFGFCPEPGLYGTTVTRPDLFKSYLTKQLAQLLRSHGGTVEVGVSRLGIPAHFSVRGDIARYTAKLAAERAYKIKRYFDVPDLAFIDDTIADADHYPEPDEPVALALFTAPRVDYSLHRLKHYTGTAPEHFQSFVLYTNYQFYIDEFIKRGHRLMSDPAISEGYTAFVEPGGQITRYDPASGGAVTTGDPPPRMPQMPAYHLVRPGGEGVTMVNIGVGPSNAKTITDHVAVLRSHCWLMVGHCAGLRHTQRLGDYVLAHAYVREDHVLDQVLPVSVPVPAIAEVQTALQDAASDVITEAGGNPYALKEHLRTGTVATVDDRNWETRGWRQLRHTLSLSRAVALDMESATIAAQGFRFRVPYGTLLCVSDKPLHGEIKLPGMADHFYRDRVNQHLEIGIRTMEKLRANGPEMLHSRKLRSFAEPAFR